MGREPGHLPSSAFLWIEFQIGIAARVEGYQEVKDRLRDGGFMPLISRNDDAESITKDQVHVQCFVLKAELNMPDEGVQKPHGVPHSLHVLRPEGFGYHIGSLSSSHGGPREAR